MTRLKRAEKVQKALLAQQKRHKKTIETLENIAFHQNGMTKFSKDSQGYKIHQECIEKLLR